MISFDNISASEQSVVIARAQSWRREHSAHVASLIRGWHSTAYPPSGSDCFHPELWKDGHWAWFNGCYPEVPYTNKKYYVLRRDISFRGFLRALWSPMKWLMGFSS